MASWAVILPADQWANERLFHNETVTVPHAAGAVAPDEEVLLIAEGHVVALTRAAKADGDDLVLAYLRRAFDRPVPAADLGPAAAADADLGPAAAADAGLGPAAAADAGLGPAAAGRGPGGSSAGVQPVGTSVIAVEPGLFRRLAAALPGGPGRAERPTWLVSVAMPIEAASPAEAVRQFWSHVRELGPAELPAYVWPSGDELAMQAFVLGEEANQDPEEDDED